MAKNKADLARELSAAATDPGYENAVQHFYEKMEALIEKSAKTGKRHATLVFDKHTKPNYLYAAVERLRADGFAVTDSYADSTRSEHVIDITWGEK